MFIDRSQIFRTAEPVDTHSRSLAMPRAAQGIHRLNREVPGQAVLPPTATAVTGLSAAAMVETASGWCRAADLRRGTLVHTLDGGLRPLADVDVTSVWPSGEGSVDLVSLTGSTLGLCEDLWLMPDQPVLIGAAPVQEVLGLPQVTLAARSLVGLPGCRIGRPDRPQQIVTLRFSQPEAVWVNSGLILCCDGTSDRMAPIAPRLAGGQAKALVELLAGEVSA